jgi:hypothetical protein
MKPSKYTHDIQDDTELPETLQNIFLPCDQGHGAGSTCQERNNIMPFQNLFSDNGIGGVCSMLVSNK